MTTVAVFLAAALAAVAALAVDRVQSVDLALPEVPDLDDVATLTRSTASVVYAADGSEIARFRPDELHVPLTADAIPRNVELAVLAAEDDDFYSHSGFDPEAIGRAVLANLRSEGIVQGGSTITQQLVKNLYTGGERSIERKIDELLVSMQLERQYDKREILAAYLNTIFLGESAYGMEAAARSYFRKTSAQLTLSEAALLAGLIPAPSRYNPRVDPDAAEERRLLVLERMAELGMIGPDRLDAERRQVPTVHPRRESISAYPYFVDYVRRWLLDVYGVEPELLDRGGLRIHTTLDPALQAAAREAVARHLPDGAGPAGATAVVDNRTGAVTALVGGRDWEASQVNFALGGLGGGTGRQPGSSFKAFVLATAFAQGASPLDRLPAPEEYFPAGSDQPVHNYSQRGYGEVTLEEATVRSINTAYVGLTELVGPGQVAELARRLGISSLPAPAQVGPSIGIGAYEVAPLEMAAAYGAFATEGRLVEPTPVARIVSSDGEVMFDLAARDDASRVLGRDVARLVTQSLRRVIEAGTGTRAAIGRPAAGKTGTSNEYGNAWFVGYSPQISAAVWVGFPEGNVPMRNVAGVARVTGGSIPAAIWRDVMTVAHADVPVAGFAPAPHRPSTQTTTTTTTTEPPRSTTSLPPEEEP